VAVTWAFSPVARVAEEHDDEYDAPVPPCGVSTMVYAKFAELSNGAALAIAWVAAAHGSAAPRLT